MTLLTDATSSTDSLRGSLDRSLGLLLSSCAYLRFSKVTFSKFHLLSFQLLRLALCVSVFLGLLLPQALCTRLSLWLIVSGCIAKAHISPYGRVFSPTLKEFATPSHGRSLCVLPRAWYLLSLPVSLSFLLSRYHSWIRFCPWADSFFTAGTLGHWHHLYLGSLWHSVKTQHVCRVNETWMDDIGKTQGGSGSWENKTKRVWAI